MGAGGGGVSGEQDAQYPSGRLSANSLPRGSKQASANERYAVPGVYGSGAGAKNEEAYVAGNWPHLPAHLFPLRRLEGGARHAGERQRPQPPQRILQDSFDVV